jgi:phage terminase large subunit
MNAPPTNPPHLNSAAHLRRYVDRGERAGCPRDQMLNFVRAGVALQDRQLAASAAARQCNVEDGPTSVGFGGARGGGKSHWLLAQMGADDCQRLPGLKCLLLRKVGKANMESFEDLRRRLFRHLPHEFIGSRGILAFNNGSRIIAGHFQAEKDIDAYLGLEYDVIGIEEATTLSSRKHQDIATCCRTSKTLGDGHHWRPRIYSTTNPGGVGHGWYKAKFIVPFQRRTETDTRFVTALVTDNQFINPEYVRQLDSLGGWQKRAWRHADWDIAAGQFFTTFKPEAHVIHDLDERRIRRWVGGFDYGFNHYTVALLGGYDGDDNLYVLDEHAARQCLPDRHANAIREMLGRHYVPGYSVQPFAAGADAFGADWNGRSVAQQYGELGIGLTMANMDRVSGWAAVLQRLGDPANGTPPRLYIHSRCARLLDCLPVLQHDPNRPEDVLKVDIDDDGNGGDDAADALRYLVATRAAGLVEKRLLGT